MSTQFTNPENKARVIEAFRCQRIVCEEEDLAAELADAAEILYIEPQVDQSLLLCVRVTWTLTFTSSFRDELVSALQEGK